MRLPRTALVALAALMLTTACEYETLDGVGTRTADADFPPQADVTFNGCRPDGTVRWHASAIIENPTAEVQTYEVTVGFYADDTRLAERSHWVRTLRPGETAEIDRSWWIDAADRIDGCRLLTVNRFA